MLDIMIHGKKQAILKTQYLGSVLMLYTFIWPHEANKLFLTLGKEVWKESGQNIPISILKVKID